MYYIVMFSTLKYLIGIKIYFLSNGLKKIIIQTINHNTFIFLKNMIHSIMYLINCFSIKKKYEKIHQSYVVNQTILKTVFPPLFWYHINQIFLYLMNTKLKIFKLKESLNKFNFLCYKHKQICRSIIFFYHV